MSDDDTTVEVDEVDQDDGPRQTVRRMPASEEVGPFFPSGMSAPEAAMAGAEATLSDDQKEKVAEMREEYGFEDGGMTGPVVLEDDDEA